MDKTENSSRADSQPPWADLTSVGLRLCKESNTLQNVAHKMCTPHMISTCRKPPSYVPYKGTYVPYEGTFGMPDQGQMLDMWESQTTGSALRLLAPYCSTSYSWSCSWSYSWSYSWTHVLGTKTMTSLILDPIARDHLYLGIDTGEKDMFLELSRDKIMIVLELS